MTRRKQKKELKTITGFYINKFEILYQDNILKKYRVPKLSPSEKV